MNYQNDPKLYDYVFYPKSWPFFIIILFFGVVSLFGGFLFFLKWWYSVGALDLKALALFVGGFLLVVAGFIGYFLVGQKLYLGLNRNGLYVQYYGFISWHEIKGFKIGWFGFGNSTHKCIYVFLHDPESFFSRKKSLGWRINKWSAKSRVLIFSSSISIGRKKLLSLLQDYHQDVLQNH